jgi:Mg-chelatase subunit ChlD
MRASAVSLSLLFLAGCPARNTADAGSLADASDTRAFESPDVFLRDAGFEACAMTSASAQRLPTSLLFQLDTSGSMNCPAVPSGPCAVADPTPDPMDSRWDVFRVRVSDALDSLPDATRAGLMHYPDPATTCAPTTADVSIAPLTSTRMMMQTALTSLTPESITPTHDAVRHGIAQLAPRTDEQRFLVLATDGAASVCVGCDAACSFAAQDADNEAMIAFVAEQSAAGISTYVIGVPGSQSFRRILSRMASAGGTARADCSDAGPRYCHFDLTDASVDFSTALRDALTAISESVVSCTYTIPPNPDGMFDPELVNVRLVDDAGMEEVIPQGATGWSYSADMLRVELSDAVCERARGLRTGRVDVLFGCPTIIL